MTDVVPFPLDVEKFEVILATGLDEHGPYTVTADRLGDGKVGDRMIFWDDRGACIHGKIVSMRPIRPAGT